MISVLFLSLLMLCMISAAASAAGDTTQNSADLTQYEAPEFGTPTVSANGSTALTITNIHYPEVVDILVDKQKSRNQSVSARFLYL